MQSKKMQPRPSRSHARLRLRAGGTSTTKSTLGDRLRKRELTIAMIGVVVTLAVAIASSSTTVVVALMGASNDRNKAAAEFQRKSRQTAYSDFLNAVDASKSADGEVVTAALHHSPFRDLQRSADTALDSLHAKRAMVQLVGTDTVFASANEVWNRAIDLYGEARRSSGFAGDMSAPGSTAVVNDYIAAIGQLQSTVDRFVKIGHDDLESIGR